MTVVIMENSMDENTSCLDSITDRMKSLCPHQEGMFYDTIIPAFLGGDDPLKGIEVLLTGSGWAT